MIEAAHLATPYQRELHDHYEEIHRKFFPRPLAYPRTIEPAPLPEPEPPPPIFCAKQIGFQQTEARLDIIRRAVCESYGVTQEELMSSRRPAELIRPRHVYCYLATRLTKVSGAMLGRKLDRDHTSILHAVRRMRKLIIEDQVFADHLERLETRIRLELGEDLRPRGCIGRYVEHYRVADYLSLGWMHVANLNEYAALLIWPCDCRFVEPKQ